MTQRRRGALAWTRCNLPPAGPLSISGGMALKLCSPFLRDRTAALASPATLSILLCTTTPRAWRFRRRICASHRRHRKWWPWPVPACVTAIAAPPSPRGIWREPFFIWHSLSPCRQRQYLSAAPGDRRTKHDRTGQWRYRHNISARWLIVRVSKLRRALPLISRTLLSRSALHADMWRTVLSSSTYRTVVCAARKRAEITGRVLPRTAPPHVAI